MSQVPAALSANPRAGSHRLAFAILILAGILFFLLHLGLGSTDMVWPDGVLREFFRGRVEHDGVNDVVWAMRLPKALLCVFAGGILGVVGSAFQGLFRNPLAEPYTIGVSSGAAVGGAIAQLIGLDASLSFLGTPLLGFIGGMLSLMLVLALARRRTGTDMTTLLLAGVVVSAFLSAILSIVVLMSGQDTNRLMSWLLGSTEAYFWERIWLLIIVFVPGALVLWLQSRKINAFAIGEQTAQRMGVDPAKLRWTVLTVGTAMAATTVGCVGAIAFLGLVAPHIARSIVGVDWRRSMPASAITGAVLMLSADALAQRGLPELGKAITGHDIVLSGFPVGVVAALLGAPSLLILLRKAQ